MCFLTFVCREQPVGAKWVQRQARVTWPLAWIEKSALLMLRRLLSILFSRARSASEHSASFKLQAQTIELAVLPGMLYQDWMGTGLLRAAKPLIDKGHTFTKWLSKAKSNTQPGNLRFESFRGGKTYALLLMVGPLRIEHRKLCSKRCSEVRPFLLGWIAP